jgi:hypothetical protein
VSAPSTRTADAQSFASRGAHAAAQPARALRNRGAARDGRASKDAGGGGGGVDGGGGSTRSDGAAAPQPNPPCGALRVFVPAGARRLGTGADRGAADAGRHLQTDARVRTCLGSALPSPDSACLRMWAESAGWGTCEPSHTYRASPSHPLCCSLPSAGAFPRFPAPHLNYPALAPTLQRGVRRRGVHSCVCDAL